MKVKRMERRGEQTEIGQLTDVLGNMLKVMERMADGIESLVDAQGELADQHRSMGLGLEKMLRVIEGKDKKWEQERARQREKEEEEDETDTDDDTEETAAGDNDGDGDVEEVQPTASA